jgi:tetratricopeptide (TPR) repeat protein
MIAAVPFALLMLWQADSDQARFEQAQSLSAQGRCSEAAPIYRQLAAAHPRMAAIPFAQGQCEFSAKNYLAACEAFQRALEADPKIVEARSLYGAALGLSGRTAEAITELRRATQDDASNPLSFRLLGMFEVESGQSGPEARAALERAVALDASDARAHYWLARLHLLTENYDAALAESAESLRLQPQSGQARLSHARALAGVGQLEAALGEYRAVLRDDPASVAAQLGSAQCLYNLQRFNDALAAAVDASGRVAEESDRRAALWLLSRLYRVLGDAAKARENERALGALEQRTNENLAKFRALQEQAMRERAAGDFAKLAATLEQALRLEQRQDSLVMLGDAYQHLNRLKDAESCYTRALAAGPEQESILQRLRGVRAALKGKQP